MHKRSDFHSHQTAWYRKICLLWNQTELRTALQGSFRYRCCRICGKHHYRLHQQPLCCKTIKHKFYRHSNGRYTPCFRNLTAVLLLPRFYPDRMNGCKWECHTDCNTRCSAEKTYYKKQQSHRHHTLRQLL